MKKLVLLATVIGLVGLAACTSEPPAPTGLAAGVENILVEQIEVENIEVEEVDVEDIHVKEIYVKPITVKEITVHSWAEPDVKYWD